MLDTGLCEKKDKYTQTCAADTVVLSDKIIGKAVRIVDIFKFDLANREPRDIWEFIVNDFPIKVSTLKDELMIYLMRTNTRQYKEKLIHELNEYLKTKIESIFIEMNQDSRLPDPPYSTFMCIMKRTIIEGK